MYCQNCGSPNNEGAKFCRQCGEELIYINKLDQENGNPVPVQNPVYTNQAFDLANTETEQTAFGNGTPVPVPTPAVKKKLPAKLIAVVVAVALAIAGGFIAFEAAKAPCIYCKEGTVKSYKISDDKVYICSDCGGKCVFCGGKADYCESVFDVITFVCDDCCDRIQYAFDFD